MMARTHPTTEVVYMMAIKNYLQINQSLHTSGQPKAEEFDFIQAQDTHTVINLAMPNSDNALSNEAELVTNLGMQYIHIPVVWEFPKKEQFELFTSLMSRLSKQTIWVHCALNWRVSCFIYLYKTLHLNHDGEEAKQNLNKFWTPDKVWTDFIRSFE